MKKIQSVEEKHRLAVLHSAISADNQRAEYAHVLLNDLPRLKKIHRSLGISVVNIEQHEQMLRKKIDNLIKHISIRFEYLLNMSGSRLFCEAYSIGDNKYGINHNSITRQPINRLGSIDLDRGYIILTQVKLIRKPNVIKLIPIKIDLKTGIVTEEYDKEI